MIVARKVIGITHTAGRFVVPCRSTGVSSRPRVRVPFPEKVAHGIAIAVGLLAVPVYISVNIKNYRQ